MTREAGHRWLVHSGEFRMFAAFWGCLLAVDVGHIGTHVLGLRLGLIVAVVAGCSRGQQLRCVTAVAVTGWLFVTGFVVNDGGVLHVTGSADAGRILAVLACAGAGAIGGRSPNKGVTGSECHTEIPDASKRQAAPEGRA